MKNKTKILAVAFILFYCVMPVFSADQKSQDNNEAVSRHYQLGNLYFQQGKYKEAQEEFKRALNISKKEAKAPPADIAEDSKEIVELLKKEEPSIGIEYKDVALAAVLQSFAFSYNLNIVYSPDIKGKVSVSLKDVTVQEALEAILASCGYSHYMKGNLIYIYPSVALEDASLITISIPLNYLSAGEAENMVSKSLSPRGDVRVNEINNSLIARDYAPVLDKIKSLIQEIDTPPLQVLIEAKLVDITSKDLQNLGVTYAATYTAPGGLFKHGDSAYDTPGAVHSADQVKGTIASAGPSSSLSGGQFKLDTFIIKNWSVTATIDALIQDQKAHLLASPSIATLNGKEAKIVIGEKVPYKEKTQTTTGTTETTKFIDVGTTLRVTPQISPDGYITMTVHPEVSSVSALLDAGPRITTREADVVIRVKDGETIVIGGLIKNENNRVRSRIPFFGYLPVLGILFGNKSVDATQTELAVFITPHLITNTEEARKQKLPQREEVYVNITGVGERALVNTLFEKAHILELNQGIESRRKDESTRMSEALDLYRNIASQFPENDKADEALYKAGKIYFWYFRNRSSAKQMFQALVNNYPRSKYYANSAYILKGLRNVK